MPELLLNFEAMITINAINFAIVLFAGILYTLNKMKRSNQTKEDSVISEIKILKYGAKILLPIGVLGLIFVLLVSPSSPHAENIQLFAIAQLISITTLLFLVTLGLKMFFEGMMLIDLLMS